MADNSSPESFKKAFRLIRSESAIDSMLAFSTGTAIGSVAGLFGSSMIATAAVSGLPVIGMIGGGAVALFVRISTYKSKKNSDIESMDVITRFRLDHDSSVAIKSCYYEVKKDIDRYTGVVFEIDDIKDEIIFYGETKSQVDMSIVIFRKIISECATDQSGVHPAPGE